jgi:hypothetical protein
MGKSFHSVILKTATAVSAIEDWLDDNCSGEWAVRMEGITEDLSVKTLRILFERPEDKERFKEAFSRGKRSAA